MQIQCKKEANQEYILYAKNLPCVFGGGGGGGGGGGRGRGSSRSSGVPAYNIRYSYALISVHKQ